MQSISIKGRVVGLGGLKKNTNKKGSKTRGVTFNRI
jgi:hypothetical protein